MNKLLVKICILTAAILIITSALTFPATYGEQSVAEDLTRGFIENVLPIDLSKYNITLTKHTTDSGPPIPGITGESINRIIDSLRYTFDSAESVIQASFLVQNNAVLSCSIYVVKGQVISDRQYSNLINAAKSFLEDYQTYTTTDSSSMIEMLDNIDVTKDSTKTTDNYRLTVSNTDYYGVQQTNFKWSYTVNGADYTSLQLVFQKNCVLDSFYDDRTVYSIGDTTVNISSEQAIDIAMKYIETYSYEMAKDYKVSGFNITEDRTTTKLMASPIDFTELRPYWNVKLYLNQTYPGSVKGFNIDVWANSGEVFACSNIAVGRTDSIDTSNVESTTSPTNTYSSQPSSAKNITLSPDMFFATVIAVVIIGLALTSLLIFLKRKRKQH